MSASEPGHRQPAEHRVAVGLTASPEVRAAPPVAEAMRPAAVQRRAVALQAAAPVAGPGCWGRTSSLAPPVSAVPLAVARHPDEQWL